MGLLTAVAAHAQTRWVVDPKASLVWWQMSPNLNHLWATGLTPEKLAALGLTLGSDVPVFVAGSSAWAEGRGEQLIPVELALEELMSVFLLDFEQPSSTIANVIADAAESTAVVGMLMAQRRRIAFITPPGFFESLPEFNEMICAIVVSPPLPTQRHSEWHEQSQSAT